MSDDVLLKQCEIDTYRASGPGGQKRNKTSSAVRLRHRPSGLIVIAEESRSQHENKAKALRRLRRAFVLERRETVTLTAEAIAELPDWASALSNDGRVHLGAKDPRFWPAIGIALDVLNGVDARISDAASLLGISTGHLNELFATDPKVWQHVNILRARFGQKPLRSST